MNPMNESESTTEIPILDVDSVNETQSPTPGLWRRAFTLAGLLVLGVAPFAQAQLDPPNYPAVCPPLTFLANPTLFDMFWGTTPIRFPYQ